MNEEIKENREEKGLANVKGFDSLTYDSNTNANIISNIKDKKKLFNLGNHVDHLLNDCVGEKIRVVDVLLKTYAKPMKEPLIDEETGEVLKDTEFTMSTVLVDDNGKSYATGSKVFGIQLMNYLRMFGDKDGFEPFEIEIVKQPVKGTNNKALGFELV